jgi:thymidine kinase
MIGGLYADYRGIPFPNIVRLLPFATKVKFMHALCTECSDGTKATLTKKIDNTAAATATTAAAAKIVGGSEKFAPVCWKHHQYE